MTKKTILSIITLLFIALFLYTGISKLGDLGGFTDQLKQSALLKPFAVWLTWIVPLTELSVTALLFFPRRRLIGLYASLILMVLFTGYLLILTYSGPYLPCGCGGLLEQLPANVHILVNVLLTTLALTGILLKSKTSYFRAPAREGARNVAQQ